MFLRRKAQGWRSHLRDAERYLRHDNVEEAASSFEQAASAQPLPQEAAALWQRAAESYAYGLDRTAARRCYGRLLTFRPHDLGVHCAVAALYEQDAREQVSRAVPGHPSVQDYLNHARTPLKAALACYAHAAVLDPQSAVMGRLGSLQRWLSMDGSAQAGLTRGELPPLVLDGLDGDE